MAYVIFFDEEISHCFCSMLQGVPSLSAKSNFDNIVQKIDQMSKIKVFL